MKNGKPKLTRRDADGLFPDLQQSGAHLASRPDNPFGEGVSKKIARRDRDEASLWKDNLVTLPKAIELPPGYESVSHVREAMERAWRMKWIRESGNEVVVEFPEGWSAVRPPSGAVELRDATGVVRAVYGWAGDAEVRLLPRYRVESQENSSSGLGSLVVRDRENGQILERSSIWSAQTGTNHPDWARLSTWLDRQYPLHRNPLRLWGDCEDNLG
ncbi:hypothetical protein R69927_03570 [Paraburkholderia domus]|jgi:hypothetical protein|uniref:hypothetical protein n=1 Tax=Paraburkholderia domus TaxID=2793075 RepID=UPI0019125EE8|nr:hypothetical protein [Paraburkholderia domus]MBK5046830.1 hypothetical protein [Burkholderia sp. R-70006]MBK5087685.1 hypothetical protein [Burkholderia sp. R-69927]CAE6706495.1 hypothetical protein R70006_01000 [Paraburkholderia domus]CAE6872942.1 hypothetical protein R69927_03570 [Paraburkholderia domus]